MLKYFLISLTMLSVSGCATAPEPIRYTNDGYAIVGEEENVQIQADHAQPFKQGEAWIDMWYIRIVNNDDAMDWCVGIEWRTLDYTINVPNRWFYVSSYRYLNIGSSTQRTWEVGDMNIAMPDAGFAVYRVLLKKPINRQCNE